MKNKIFVLCGIILLIILCATIIATTVQANNTEKVMVEKKIGTTADMYVEINAKTRATNDSEVFNTANNYIKQLEIKCSDFNSQNSTVKYYNNALDNRKETKIINGELILTLNTNTNELITYVSNKSEFPKNTIDENTIKELANNIFQKVNVTDKNMYELTFIEKFDDEIWRAEFTKKYGDKYCAGESVKFSFAPESNEIVTLAINNIKYANNETKITEEQASNIAEKYLDKSSADNMTITKEIIRPNFFYKQLEGDSNIYANIEQYRNAYVFTFDNEAQSQVYIDCSTGEVLGGNMKLGGEY